jgi:hypothetical protein
VRTSLRFEGGVLDSLTSTSLSVEFVVLSRLVGGSDVSDMFKTAASCKLGIPARIGRGMSEGMV